MKKLLLAIGFISYATFSQCVDPLITDFECSPASHTLPGTVVSISNTFSGGINTSTNIGQYTDDGTNGWDALIIDYGTSIDLSTNNQLSFKLYSTSSIQVLAKIQGGTTAREIWSTFSTTNTWEQFTFDFSPYTADGNTTLVLFFNASVTSGTASDLYYFDDLKWSPLAALSHDEITVTNEIKTSPNPVEDFLTITSKSEIIHITISDISAKKILSTTVDGLKSYEVDISSLSSGIYIATIKTEESTKIVKILKK
jgi:hypothetical protein